MISIYHRGIGILPFWMVLNSVGNTNFKQRTRMTKQTKLEKLFFILAVGFCWSHKTGLLAEEEKPIRAKKDARKAKSAFRLEFAKIRSMIFSTERQTEVFLACLGYI